MRHQQSPTDPGSDALQPTTGRAVPPTAGPTTRRGPVLPVLLATLALVAACSDANSVGDGPAPTATASPALSGTTAGSGDSTGPTPSPTTGGAPAATALGQIPLSLTLVASVSQPLALTQRPGDDDLWVAEREGRVRLVERTVGPATGEGPGPETMRLLTEPVLDVSDQVGTGGEGGLLGLAFSPDGSQLYLDYTDRNGNTTVAGYPVDASGPRPTIDRAQGRTLLTVDQPYSNHNGGGLLFGPDGMLYITLGDGGGGGDPELTGQDPTDLLGSILRLDPTPDGSAPYTIPPDNPFAASSAGERPEVWIWGVRNPWRISFDQATGDLWVADVGQNVVEEIDLLRAADGGGRGANLGWNLREGNEPYAGDPPPDHVEPIATYRHDNGRCSVTGGYVYRGSTIAGLDGAYLYADYCSGEIFALRPGSGGADESATMSLNRPGQNIVAFGQDSSGEVYVLELSGAISRLTAPGAGPTIEVTSS